jgi:hypothetical protein
MPKHTDEITALEKRRAKLDAQIKERKERRKQEELAQEEKRKLLAGAVVLDFMAANPADPFTVRLLELIDRSITRPTDRALFSVLSNLNGTGPAPQQSSTAEAKPSTS